WGEDTHNMPHTCTVAAQHVQIGAAASLFLGIAATSTICAGDAYLACLWAGGKEESRWRGGSGGSVLAPRGLTGLLSPCVKPGTKLFQPYFMSCFNCASPAVLVHQ